MHSLHTPVAEIERKWILSNLPTLESFRSRGIAHYYTKEGRFTMDTYSDGNVKFIHCIKKPLQEIGGNSEEEKEIDSKTFLKKTEGIIPLRKTRTDFLIGGRKWEVDVFQEITLIIAEVEWIFPLEDIRMQEVEAYQVPEEMRPFIISEVTGNSDFSNFQLSQKIYQEIELYKYVN